MRNSTYKVQVIDRALALLETLAERGPAMTLRDLAREVGLPKSTTLRLLSVMQGHRFVEKVPESGNYQLGLKLLELGDSAAAQFDFAQRARPHLNRLTLATGESGFLSVLDGNEAVALECTESTLIVRVAVTRGLRTPAYCTANGKAILAFLPPGELTARFRSRKLRAFTPNTITDIEALEKEFASVRKRGYAVDHEEMEVGLRCIAAPVRNQSSSIVASVGILGPVYRLPDADISRIAARVVASADVLSHELGWRQVRSGTPARSGQVFKLGVGA